MGRAALLIGVSQHGAGLRPLPAAAEDVRAVQRVLQASQWGDFELEYPLIDPELTDMLVSIEKFFSAHDADDTLLLFFSGYALTDAQGRLYFSTRSTNKSVFRSTSVPASFLKEAMDNSRCRRQMLVLDCCFCDDARKFLKQSDRALDLNDQLGAEGRVILITSETAQYSFEHKQSDLSIYTRYWVEGIETGLAALHPDPSAWMTVKDAHEYAARKTQIVLPNADPRLLAMRDEDASLPLAKPQPLTGHLKYREAAERYARSEQFSLVDQAILATCRSQFGVTVEEAAQIEAQVLHPYREHLRFIQIYRDRIPVLQDHYPDEQMGDRLKELQLFLGLADDDVAGMNREILNQIQLKRQTSASQQRLEMLQQYRAAFAVAAHQGYPLSDEDQAKFQDLQRVLGLMPDDVALIEEDLVSRIEAQRAERDRKLKQYEVELRRMRASGLPLNEMTRSELQKFQQVLGLSDEEIATLEQSQPSGATSQAQPDPPSVPASPDRETHLKRYEQEVLQAVLREYPLGELTQQRLKAFQESLELSDAEVETMQRRIFDDFDAQRATHQTKLERYREEFDAAVRRELPLSASAEAHLQDIQRSLNLTDVDVKPLQREVIDQIKSEEADHQDHIDQYAQEFSRTIQQEYPVSQETRDRLKELQTLLNLSQQDIQTVEETAIAALKTEHQVAQSSADSLSESLDLRFQETDPENHPEANPGNHPQTHLDQPAPPVVQTPINAAPSGETGVSGAVQPLDEIRSPLLVRLLAELEDLLEKGLWRQADEKTLVILLHVSGQTETWMSKAVMGNLPCNDLKELDRLWTVHSHGRFGFSVQRRIFNSLNGADAIAFAKQVGWWQSRLAFFKPYDFLTFTLQAKEGHLPAKWFWDIPPNESRQSWGLGFGRGGTAKDPWMLAAMMAKLHDCHIPASEP